MGAMRAPQVERTTAFDQDVKVLSKKYPEIEEIVTELAEFLTAAWNPPHVLIDPKQMPGWYVTQLDYFPAGANGLSRFIVVYHATPQTDNPMQNPLRSYTLHALVEP